MKNRTVLSALLCAGLLSTAPLAQAGDSWSSRAVSTVGHYIAAQGNAALQQIQADLVENLAERVKPELPSQDNRSASAQYAAGARFQNLSQSASAQ